jgi:predicted adenine nucleotide alpha hydrolase (AANH) superfamily ATPase
VKKPQNLHQWEIQHLSELAKLTTKPKLLMHSCCAVCNAWPLEYLYPYFEITLYYNNSNIAPHDEYTLRLRELKAYVDRFNAMHATMIDIAEEPYDYDTYKSTFLEKRADDKEGTMRCGMCYALRINQALQYASLHGFDYVTTVMTISRQKNADKINDIAKRLMGAYPNLTYFYSNFKKAKGIDFSVNTAKALGIYRQEYCGCEYSFDNVTRD